MFPVESLPAHYYEERKAAEGAKHLAQLQAQAAAAQAQKAAPANSSSSQSTTNLRTTTGIQRPAATVLGSILSGFARSASLSPPTSGASTPACTPPANKLMTQAALEAKMAEKRRDEDIVGFRAW